MRPTAVAGAPNAEEFVMLQEQLLTLKMHNHDLEQGNQRARGMPMPQPPSPLSSSPNALSPEKASAAELASKLSSQLKVGASAVSALSAKGAASLRSTLQIALDGEEALQRLRQEVAPLKDSLRFALEELVAAKKGAIAAQQRAAALASEGPGEVKVPRLEDLRQELAGEAEAPSLSDASLRCLAVAVLELAEARRHELAAEREKADAAGDQMDPLEQIQKQQQDLESVRGAIDKQEAQIGRLMNQVSHDNVIDQDSQQILQEKLQAQHNLMVDMSQRLATSDGLSSHLYELTCHVAELQQRRAQRDRAIEYTLGRQSAATEEQALLRGKMREAKEGLTAARRQDAADAEAEATAAAAKVEAAAATMAEAKLQWLEESRRSPRASIRPAAAVERPSVGVQADAKADQAGVTPSGSGAAEEESSAELRERLRRCREEKLVFERLCAKEVQDLRGKVRGQTSLRRRAEAEEVVPEVQDPPAGRVDEAEATSNPGLLYVKKIAELEALQQGLESDLDLLQSSEQCLVEDTREKAELIKSLMRTVHTLPKDGPGDLATERKRRKGSKTGKVLRSIRKALGAGDERRMRIRELEREAEESLLDNLRLRRDLRGIAEELRKALADEQVAAEREAAQQQGAADS